MNMQEAHHMESDTFFEYKETIQEILYRTLDKPDFSLQAKLFSLVCFAQEMHPFFHPQTENFAVEKMAAVVDKLYNHQFERTWQEQMQEQEVNLELPMSLVLNFLLQAFKKVDKDMQNMLPQVWEQLFGQSGENDPYLYMDESEGKLTIKCEAEARTYAKQRDQLWDYFSTELDGYLQNYCTHFVFAKSYTQKESLPEYVQEVILRVMILKFFLVKHPGVQDVLDRAMDLGDGFEEKQEELIQSLDAQVMQIMKIFSNNISNQEETISKLLQLLQEQGMQDLAHMALLVQF